MVRVLISIVVFVCVISCMDQKLYLQSIKNTDALDIDGVYINQGDMENVDEKYCDIILFYNNSIIKQGLVLKDRLVNNIEEAIKQFHQLSKDNKTSYGVYQLHNDEIYLEFWSPSTGGARKTTINRGKVLDKESFTITYMRTNYGGEELKVNALYTLHPLKNKPDSTNRFIK